ncbi:hypothetical protein AALO_G00203500 [Alosa alosa]|uniref:Uncharacterized protein n=1 Tax=Alosa alosa TaxID=278164 RepID=A0AAV6G362_9TELE|nr:hypothetical protein AALO_G00203500 [Alosa alosa]
MRFVSSTSTDTGSVISEHFWLDWKSRGIRHSSRPSKMNMTLCFELVKTGERRFISEKKCSIRSNRLSFFSFNRFNSRKGRGNMNWTSSLVFPSAQSKMNLCTETVFPMPATPTVNTVLIVLCCPGKGLKMSLQLIGVSSIAAVLEAFSICLISCCLLTSSLSTSVMYSSV